MDKRICIIGQFPPPIHGLSKALDTLYNSELKEKYQFGKIDLTDNKRFIGNLIKLIKSNYDIYYLTISQSKFGNIRDLVILKLIQMKNKKIIIHLHGGGFRNVLDEDMNKIQRRLNYRILGRVDIAIVLGESLKSIFKGIVPSEKIKVVKNCVDNEFVINDKEFDSKINKLKTKGKYNILYLSNFIEDKGYKDVLNLAKYIKDLNDNRFNFIFAGKFFFEKDKEQFFKFIKDNNLNEIIDYRGIVNGKDKKNLLKESDYFILLTRYKNEGQPISIIEAAANGLEVITTNHAGILDILDEHHMLVFDTSDIRSEEIYKKIIEEYLNLENKYKLLAINREKIIREFSQENYLMEIDRIFDRI